MDINVEIWLRFTSIGQDVLSHIKTHNQISEVKTTQFYTDSVQSLLMEQFLSLIL